MKQTVQTKDGGHRGVVMAAVFIATFMTSVEVTIVTTALPEIISQLHGLAFQSWIMSAYLFTTAITTPIYGKLADTMGRKPIFQWGVLIFTLGSLMSGLAPNIGWLIIARALQGIGAGAVMPLTFTIIADYFSFEQRSQVLALNNTAWGLSALIGPLLGGFLVDKLSWHWVFFVNIPLGIIVMFLIAYGYTKNSIKPAVSLKIDWAGICSLTLGLLCLLLAVQNLSAKILLSCIFIICAVLALIALVHFEHRAQDPLIDPQMFVNRTFTIQIITTMILSGILISYQVYFPIWLQSIYHLPATTAGLVVSSSSIMWLVASFFVGYLIAHVVPKNITLIVVFVQLLFYGLLIFAKLDFPVWLFYVIAAVNGAGMGTIITMNTVLAQHLVSSELVGSASAIITLGRSLGQTIMTGIYGAIFNFMLVVHRGSIPLSTLNRAVSANSSASFANSQAISLVLLDGLHAVFIVVTFLLILVFILNILDPNRHIIK